MITQKMLVLQEKFFGGVDCSLIIRKVALSETVLGRFYINCFLTG